MLLSGPCAPLQATMMGMQSAPVKPEKGLADDLPELAIFSPYGDEKDVMLAILSQNSKLAPRSSFYTVDAPEGLPRNLGAAPNRLMHEYGRERMLRFMNEVHDRPQKLSHEVGVRVVMGMVDMLHLLTPPQPTHYCTVILQNLFQKQRIGQKMRNNLDDHG